MRGAVHRRVFETAEAVLGLCYTKASIMLLAGGMMNSKCLNNLCGKVNEL